METLWTCAVALLLGLWFLASIVHQVAPVWLSRFVPSDLFGLVPRWLFFAPNPSRADTHVVYRDRRESGWGTWQALTPAMGDRRWRWVWHPQRYPTKAATDLVNGLRRTINLHREAPRAIVLSNAYLALLHWVAAQPVKAGVTHRQFAIVTSHGFAHEEVLNVLFVSEPHRLTP
jgi:hypothetical protein